MRQPAIDIEPAEIEVARMAIASINGNKSTGGHIGPGQVVIERLDPYCAAWGTPEDQADGLRSEAKDDPLLLEAIEDFLLKRETDVPTALMVQGIEGLDLQSLASRKKASGRFQFGFCQISRAGLSRDGQLAVIAHSYLGGPLMGFGKYSVFEQVDGRWVPSTREIKAGWIS